MKKIILNATGKVRSGWWILIFFIFLSCFLLPAILLAQHHSKEVPLYVQAILIMLVTVICQLLRREPITVITGRFNLTWLKEFSGGVVIGATLMILTAMFLTISGLVHWQLNNLSFTEVISGLGLFGVVAIAEELLFRGFIFQRLIESLGRWPAQFIIAGLFVLTHLNNPGMTEAVKALAVLNIFIASILFGLAFLKTQSLAMPIGIHFMANWVQGTMLGFGVSGNLETGVFKPILLSTTEWITGGVFGLEASLVCLVVLVIITTCFCIISPRNNFEQ